MFSDKIFDFLEENEDLVNDGNIKELVEQFSEGMHSWGDWSDLFYILLEALPDELFNYLLEQDAFRLVRGKADFMNFEVPITSITRGLVWSYSNIYEPSPDNVMISACLGFEVVDAGELISKILKKSKQFKLIRKSISDNFEDLKNYNMSEDYISSLCIASILSPYLYDEVIDKSLLNAGYISSYQSGNYGHIEDLLEVSNELCSNTRIEWQYGSLIVDIDKSCFLKTMKVFLNDPQKSFPADLLMICLFTTIKQKEKADLFLSHVFSLSGFKFPSHLDKQLNLTEIKNILEKYLKYSITI